MTPKMGMKPNSNKEIDENFLDLLGEPTKIKKWLTVSLDKTIRLQLNPTANMRALSAMAGPDWIRQ